MTPEYIRTVLVGAHGWVYYNWAKENERDAWGALVERKSDGYVRQEFKRLMKE